MVQSYYEDSSVSEAGALGRFGRMLSGFARGVATVGAIGAWFGSLFSVDGMGVKTFFDALQSGGIGSAFTAVGAEGVTFFAGASALMGAIAVAGGTMQALQSFKNGQNKKGIKQLVKGVAEGAFIGAAVLASVTVSFAAGAGFFLLPALEIASKLGTGKTITAHFGNAVGAVLDTVMGKDEFGKNTQQAVNVAQAQGLGMQQQMGVAPAMAMPQPTYGQMMAPSGMAYSAVPAGVGMPQMAMAQQPPATYWQDYVAPERATQQEAPVRLSPQEAGHYADRVNAAREAAAQDQLNQQDRR